MIILLKFKTNVKIHLVSTSIYFAEITKVFRWTIIRYSRFMIYIPRLTSNFTNTTVTTVSRYYDNEIQNVAYDTCNINIKGIYGKHSNTSYTGIPPDFTIPCFATQNFAISPRKCNAVATISLGEDRSFCLTVEESLFIMDAAVSFNGEAMELTIIKIWLKVTNYEKITRTLFLRKIQGKRDMIYIMYFLLPYF